MEVHENVELKWSNMHAGIMAQIDYVRTAPRSLYEQAKAKLVVPKRLRNVYMVGCGDSHYCGLAARLAFQEWTGLNVEALESLEFSRYVVDFAPAESLVIGVSNSGNVARTCESIIFAKRKGLATCGITYNHQGRLASEAQAVILYEYKDTGFGPGTISYIASLVSLYVVGLRLAEVLGKMTHVEVEAKLAEIEKQAGAIAAALEDGDKALAVLGQETDLNTSIFIIGGGPNYGTALFGMAKLIEAAACNATGQELEEWAHEQYFCTKAGTLTFVIAPPGRSVDRAREQIQAARDMGSKVAVIGSADDEETKAQADIFLSVPAWVRESLSPISYCLATELFAYHFASTKKNVTMLGFDDANRMSVNFRQIFGSKIPGDQ